MNRAQGLTLIGVMISLLLSSSIVLLLVTLYSKYQRLYASIEHTVQYNENKRFIRGFLENQIIRAGFHNKVFLPSKQAFPEDVEKKLAAGQVVLLRSESDLLIRYQPIYPNQLSCDGRNISRDIKNRQEAADLPLVSTRIYFDKHNKVLRCNGHSILESIDSVYFDIIEEYSLKGRYVKAVYYEIYLLGNTNPVIGKLYLRNALWLANN
ncbi:hypothetical protein VQ643_01715 [Pseudomonas sp. F1_0610]|uniref:hypothetical protein n=1 Tax=Pseudomonas sp. F1_0610 TaxID=3114284 RepID=UPI0039C2575F